MAPQLNGNRGNNREVNDYPAETVEYSARIPSQWSSRSERQAAAEEAGT